jgi:hypothetical protein
MTPLVWANFPVALLFILAWPGIPLRTAPGGAPLGRLARVR